MLAGEAAALAAIGALGDRLLLRGLVLNARV